MDGGMEGLMEYIQGCLCRDGCRLGIRFDM